MPVVPIPDLRDYINDNIKLNGVRGITGGIHNTALIDLLDTLENEINNISQGNGHEIEDEGVSVPQRGILNFVGALVSISDDSVGDKTIVTISSSPAAAKTGTNISFSSNEIYNSPSSPGSAAITNDLSNSKIGIVQKIYHQNGSIPSFPAGWVKLGSGS